MIQFFIQGIPIPQGSHRKTRSGHIIDSNPRLKKWRDTIRQTASANRPPQPIDKPVEVTAVFAFQRPKHTKFPDYPAGKGPGDLDKLERAIGDGLEQSRILTNDARIVTWRTHKRWCVPGEHEGCIIQIKEL
ncbi:RusA family crossover junction endodeoxyribonuclease [Corynebacterium vitaeruminis]|uniref:RusA family crossover junction endodeoxyribonuclease n=1 Tax=Corynebacterium vitaeruminis TaxID=38305 RepID=UPI0023F3DA31|nr:RusA family crossover junction endodeoxyribonuclease [Corynebacterium vitaeruminis]